MQPVLAGEEESCLTFAWDCWKAVCAPVASAECNMPGCMWGAQISGANALRERIRRHLDALLGDDGLLFVPSAPGPAPLLKTPQEQLNQFRMRLLALTSIAGLCGLPQARACYTREHAWCGRNLPQRPAHGALLQASVQLGGCEYGYPLLLWLQAPCTDAKRNLPSAAQGFHHIIGLLAAGREASVLHSLAGQCSHAGAGEHPSGKGGRLPGRPRGHRASRRRRGAAAPH